MLTENQRDDYYMKYALVLASSAAEAGEVPVGALIVENDRIISEAANSPISSCDPTAHAEITAIRIAAEKYRNYRLPHATLYVTLEPCIMCMGALIHARIKRLVFGAYDPKTGAAGSRYSIGLDKQLNHQIITKGGVCEAECSTLLRDFFRARRKKKNSAG